MKIGYKTMLRYERSEQKIFWFVPPVVTFWGTLVANEVNFFIHLGGKTAVWGHQLPPVLLLVYVTEEYRV